MEEIFWSSERKEWQGQEGALKSAALLVRLLHEYPLGCLGRLYLVGPFSRGRGGAGLVEVVTQAGKGAGGEACVAKGGLS